MSFVNDTFDYKAFNDDFESEITITGFSGRFPECSTVEEFRDNLFNGVDMVNDEARRWPKDLYDLPSRMGKIKEDDLKSFDLTFFGIPQKQAEVFDPALRLLLEVTYEAIIDSGNNPQSFRGSRTGVYLGTMSVDTDIYRIEDSDLANGYVVNETKRTMFAKRISSAFDFRGPSYAIDTACSSSLYAMAQAFADLQSGQCDAAVVAGTNLILDPLVSVNYVKLNMLSPDGTCKTFDESGNGIVRSDACVVMLLQKANVAHRIYATILNVHTNTDGAKDEGITCPSGQKKLFAETFADINLNPHDITYIEAHGTGTDAEDEHEVNAICDFFCHDRKVPLLIGSVKSNMGHSEGASALCSIAKMLIAMEEGVIPGNLHYKNPNPKLYGIIDGRLMVVDRNTPWNGGIIAVNSFGFDGTNGHIIMKSNPKPKMTKSVATQRLVTVSGRTMEAVRILLEDIEAHAEDDEYLALVNEVYTKNIPRYHYRGYTIVGKTKPLREVMERHETKPPVWFIYSGMGSQWTHMGKELMKIDIFKQSINVCAKALESVGIDLIRILTQMHESQFRILESFVAIASIQIALTDLLAYLGIKPDGMVGHSTGELGCAYGDGCLTAEQTVLVAYWRGRCVIDTYLINGMMASVALSWDDCISRLPDNILPVCNNSADNVTISGPTESVKNFVQTLNEDGIFAQTVNVYDRAFHSKYVNNAGTKFRKFIKSIIPNPKNRSEKWISSSIPQSKWDTPLAKESSAEYHVNNFLSPVLFYEATQHIPSNAVCIEIAPHGLMQAILKRSLGKDVLHLSLIRRMHVNNIEFFLTSIGKLYGAGLEPAVNKLFPQVSFPLGRGTPMLNSKIKWDHSVKFDVPYFGANNKSSEAKGAC